MKRTARERKYLGDILPPPAPPGVPSVRWQKGYSVGFGDVIVGWYRGQQLGQWESVLALRKMGYTRAAERLRKNWGLNKKGDLEL